MGRLDNMNSHSNENENRLKKIRWRCSRRGMLELDEILVHFFDKHFQQLSPERQAAFEELLSCPDPDLLAWLMGRGKPDDAALADIVERICDSYQPPTN